MTEVVRALSPKGKAIYIIGENTVKGTYIRNSAIVRAVAHLSGLKLDASILGCSLQIAGTYRLHHEVRTTLLPSIPGCGAK